MSDGSTLTSTAVSATVYLSTRTGMRAMAEGSTFKQSSTEAVEMKGWQKNSPQVERRVSHSGSVEELEN